MTAQKKTTTKTAKASKAEPTFPEAFAKLLRKRKIKVPGGLADAPPEAYANQPAAVVERLEGLDDSVLATQAEKIATYAQRQAERAQDSWESSPLIAELRRRKLKVPARPKRVVGAAISLKKPLSDWSDRELLDAATEWSKKGR